MEVFSGLLSLEDLYYDADNKKFLYKGNDNICDYNEWWYQCNTILISSTYNDNELYYIDTNNAVYNVNELIKRKINITTGLSDFMKFMLNNYVIIPIYPEICNNKEARLSIKISDVLGNKCTGKSKLTAESIFKHIKLTIKYSNEIFNTDKEFAFEGDYYKFIFVNVESKCLTLIRHYNGLDISFNGYIIKDPKSIESNFLTYCIDPSNMYLVIKFCSITNYKDLKPVCLINDPDLIQKLQIAQTICNLY